MKRGGIAYGLAVVVVLLSLLLLAPGYGVEAQLVRVGDVAPEIAQGPWINSEPLTLKQLRGKVVLVEFWTYG